MAEFCSHIGHTHLEIKGYPYLLGNYVNVCPFPRRVLGSRLKRAIETIPQLYSEDRYGQVLEKELQEEIRHSKEGKGQGSVWQHYHFFNPEIFGEGFPTLCF